MLQQIVLGLIGLTSNNFHLLLDQSEEVTEKFVEQRRLLIVIDGL